MKGREKKKEVEVEERERDKEVKGRSRGDKTTTKVKEASVLQTSGSQMPSEDQLQQCHLVRQKKRKSFLK